MTPQLMYDAITSLLQAVLNVSERLEAVRAEAIRGDVLVLQKTSRYALEQKDAAKLSLLCDEVLWLSEDVRKDAFWA